MVIWIIVFGTAIWVLIDAKNIGVKKGLVSGLGNMGPWGWFFVTLLFWILGFPMYLYYRGKFKRAVAEANSSSNPPSSETGNTNVNRSERGTIEDIEKYALLKEKGIITDAEFESKKKQILGL